MPKSPKLRYSQDQRERWMLLLESDRISTRLKQQIERLLDICDRPEARAARSAAAKAAFHARKAGQLSPTARARQERAERMQAAAAYYRPAEALQPPEPSAAPIARPDMHKPLAPHPAVASTPIAQTAQDAGLTASDIAAYNGAVPHFVEAVFAGKHKPLPWMYVAIEALRAEQSQHAEAAD